MRNSFLNKLKPTSIGASMADMALLPLIFFMTSTTIEPPKGVEVELPKAKTQGAEQDTLYLTISKNSEVYLDGKTITLDDLRNALEMRQREKDRTVSITADKNIAYKTVAHVLKVLQEQDFLNVVFMSEPLEGSSS
jgi:biopolymer transport protein ExbD